MLRGMPLPRKPAVWTAIWRALAAGARAIAGPIAPTGPIGLEHCPECRRDRVVPVEWEPQDASSWAVTLRCGECGMWRELVASNEEVARYDVVLGRHEDAIRRALVELDDAAGFPR
jgi:hypothetical protein